MNTIMTLPKACEKIIRTLESAGFEAYAVGGCVRDALMGMEPKDFDLTTSALPEDIKRLFPHTIDTGIEHGTVTVLQGGAAFEVTTYRTEEGYSDHRRPDHVCFHATLQEDLSRRDFTVNAMAYHPDRGLVDPFGGQDDLKKQVIRCVGEPARRFEEDALRILRAVRFSARLDFSIEEKTRQAMKEKGPELSFVSRERVFSEMTLTLMSAHPERLSLIVPLGLCPYISASLGHGEELDFDALTKVPAQRELRYAALLYPIGAKRAGAFLHELKSDNELREGVTLLVSHVQDPLPCTRYMMRLWIHEVGREGAARLLCLMQASGLQTSAAVDAARKRYAIEKDQPLFLGDLALNGRDVILLTGIGGVQVGKALSFLMAQVLQDPCLNQKDGLVALLQSR